MPDAYLSLLEALKHAGIKNRARVEVKWVDAEALEEADLDEAFRDVSGILVPGGFGVRGIEGKVRAAQYARERKIPYLASASACRSPSSSSPATWRASKGPTPRSLTPTPPTR